MHSAAIHTHELGHTYPSAPAGQRPALDRVSLDVVPGEIFGILGPNGGGKTTLLRILTTRLRPSAGKAVVDGHDVLQDPAAVRRAIGVVFQSPSLDDKLTATENIVCHAGLYGIGKHDARQHAALWLDRFGLAARAAQRVEHFSGGMRRRVEIAKALVHRPKVLLMDEPSTGLDPAALRSLWDVLHSLRDEAGLTIALTTHLMNEAERCDRLAMLCQGQLIACDTPAALRSTIGGDVVTLEPEVDRPGLAPLQLNTLADHLTQRFSIGQGPLNPVKVAGASSGGAGVRVLDGRLQFEHPEGARAVAEVASAFPGRFRSLAVGRPTLEDVFVHLTGSAFTSEPVADES